MGAFYSNTVAGFLQDERDQIIGGLITNADKAGFYDHKHSQTSSWNEEIDLLKSSFLQIIEENSSYQEWGILLEYPISRRQKRIDAVIVISKVIIVIEFKVGKSDYLSSDKEQVLDYCLDLKDFHFESRDKILVPMLLATEGKLKENEFVESSDFIKEILFVNKENLTKNLLSIVRNWGDNGPPEFKKWDNSDYSPIPTIVEAAQSLYFNKSVVEISQSHARKVKLAKPQKQL